jgi:hypothetical protein
VGRKPHVGMLVALLCAALLLSTSTAGARATDAARPLKKWSSVICKGFARWEDQITKVTMVSIVGQRLRGLPSSASSEDVRIGVPPLLDAILAATDRLSRDVFAAGTPKTTEGPMIADAVASSVQGLSAVFVAFKIRAEGIKPGEEGPLFSLTNDLASVLQSGGNSLAASVQQLATAYPASRINKAFAAKACKGLV